jgi:hypothetical protein
VMRVTNQEISSRSLLLMAALILLPEGYAVVAVADAAVTVVATTVKVGAKVVGAAVDLLIPGDDQKEKK